MTNPTDQRAVRMMTPAALGAMAAVTLASMLGLGLTGLSSVGSDRWIEASYGGPARSMTGPLVQIGAVANVNETPAKLVVGDEQQWLTEPRIQTEKTVASNAAGFALGDRVVFSIAAKGQSQAPARTFEIVGIEILSAPAVGPAVGNVSSHAPQVLIAREVDVSGKPNEKSMTLRLLVSEGEVAQANKSL